MDSNNMSTKMSILKQRLKDIESREAPMSPAPPSPRVPDISPPFVGTGSNLDVSGFAPLEDSVYEANSIRQQPRHQRHHPHNPPPALSWQLSPPEASCPRVRHVSDRNLTSSERNLTSTGAQNEFVGRSVTFEDANFNGGLTLPTSAAKKKAGMRSYLSTPDFGATGGAPPSAVTTGGDETGPRKRSLGKARRVLKTSESTSPKDDNVDDKAGSHGYPSTDERSASKCDDVPAPIVERGVGTSVSANVGGAAFSLGTIDESDDRSSQDTRSDDLVISDLRLSDDLDVGVPDLNASFGEYSSADDLRYNDENGSKNISVMKPGVNQRDGVSSAKWTLQDENDAESRVKGGASSTHYNKSPLQEIQCFNNVNNLNGNNHRVNVGAPLENGDASNPARPKGDRNPAATMFPHTPMQRKAPSTLKSQQQQHSHPHQQHLPQTPHPPKQSSQPHHHQQQQQQHLGSTPMRPMRPPQMPLFTPAQPSFSHHPPQPYHSRKQKFVDVNRVSYQLIRQIGSGGSCKVHQAADFEKQRLVAIKIVDLDEVDQEMIDSYKNEITILKKLQHSNRVVKLIDFEISKLDNLLYIVMECGDCDLATIFNERVSRNDITSNLIRFYWEEMLSCIAVTHAEGIVHSDLKPANFLVVNGTLKLIDFGIANAIQSDKTSITRDSQIGTLNYMSPEAILDTQPPQEDGEEEGKPRIKIGTRSDVWSLGCILYSMVYTRTPFHHLTNHLSKIQAIINPRFNIKFNDVSNEHLLDVMRRCLNREPKSRPSVDQLLAHPYLRS